MTAMSKALFIGLLSGTSVDAIDAVIIELTEKTAKLIATHSEPIPSSLQQQIRTYQQPNHDDLDQIGQLDVELGELFAQSCQNLLAKAKLSADAITAIGSHGQTIRHCPSLKHPYSLQIGDPNIIAARTHITTVADFRRRDIALGGQGAPLAPAFHQFMLQNKQENRCVINLGGIANITYLPKENTQAILGFDTGPANTLMDAWCREHRQQAYDNNGTWAQTGTVNQALLKKLLQDSYFAAPPPKSTGPEYFNLNWLKPLLPTSIKAEDVQATLLELTAQSITHAIQGFCNTIDSIWLCGGGSHNGAVVKRLQALNHCSVQSTKEIDLEPDWLEAMLFAWLAAQTLAGKTSNTPSVTGARHASVLGAIYPA